MRIIVVGAGMQGRVIARNLRERDEKPEVVCVDIKEPESLPQGVTFQRADVLDAKQAAQLAQGADAMVLAVPSEISHGALENLIAAGATVADVSFTPDPPLSLHDKAVKSGACCVVDCGIAPGLSHVLAGRAYADLGGIDALRIWVGGMPQNPPPVFRHAVYFNPHDLIAEYIRPARARKDRSDFAPHPLDVPVEHFSDPELGQLEAFLSDGLRSLLTSFPDVADMAELTLRWPGHIETMKNLREIGLFDDAAACRAVGNTLGARYPADKHADVLVMFVEAKRGKESRAWRVIDRRTDGESAMSRTTGFTTAATAMLLARKQFKEPGVHPPEHLGKDSSLVDTLIKDLNERGVKVSDMVSRVGKALV